MNSRLTRALRHMTCLVAGLLCLLSSHVVSAGPFEQGVLAYQNKEFKRAHDIWLPIAEQGHVLAQTLLGALYAYGEGVERNDVEAVKWFERAAYAGSAQAQYNLGILYENGWGVEKSLIRARHWYRLAADQGRKDAASRYALIADPDMESSPTSTIESREVNDKTTTSDLMPTIPINMPAEVQPEVTQNNRPVARDSKDATTTWLRSQPARHYTLQLVASTERQLLVDNINNLGLASEGYAVVESRQDAQTWYGLIYGSFKTFGEAQQAIRNLPPSLRQHQPWIRTFADIKSWREQVEVGLIATPGN